MAVIEKIGVALERVGQRLQSRETAREPVTPYDHAKRLWQTVDPRREIDPMKSLFLPFRPALSAEDGVSVGNTEQAIYSRLLEPYRSLFPQLDKFCVTLSISHKRDPVSFAATVLAPPPSPLFNQEKYYPVLAVRELPADDNDDTPYNLLILAESEPYTGKLDRELQRFDPEKGLVWRKFEALGEETEGDIEWRKRFVGEVFAHWTKLAASGGESITHYNREVQARFIEQKKSTPWWRRILQDDQFQRGAVWPYFLAVYCGRDSYDPQARARAAACFQQA